MRRPQCWARTYSHKQPLPAPSFRALRPAAAGAAPVELPAVREAGGYSVLGFWPANGAGQPPDACVKTGILKADNFILYINGLALLIICLTVLVLNNAAIHKAHLVHDCQVAWAARGLPLHFMPPYGPKLNKIEVLWYRCKQYWIRPEDYASDYTSLEKVEYALKNAGSLHILTFT